MNVDSSANVDADAAMPRCQYSNFRMTPLKDQTVKFQFT